MGAPRPLPSPLRSPSWPASASCRPSSGRASSTLASSLCLPLVPGRNGARFSLRVRFARGAPCLQRQKEPRRLPLLVTLRPRHRPHPRQERRPTRVVARLNRRLQVHPLRLRRRAALCVQAASLRLPLFPLPGRRLHPRNPKENSTERNRVASSTQILNHASDPTLQRLPRHPRRHPAAHPRRLAGEGKAQGVGKVGRPHAPLLHAVLALDHDLAG